MFSFFLSGVVGECYYSFSGGAWWYNGKKRDSNIKYIVFFLLMGLFHVFRVRAIDFNGFQILTTFFSIRMIYIFP